MEDLLPTSTTAEAMLTVTGLNRLVRDCLERSFPLTWVRGEITNLTLASSGHLYFSLKDAGAQVRCVMWRGRAQTLGWRPENGQQVEARALVSFYEPRGEFQLNIEQLRRAGQGNLYEQFLALKQRLTAEGLFDAARKRPLPAFPRHLAIVTSLQAAALRDVLTTLHRRAPQIALTIVPTLVQGDGAATRIADALATASECGAEAILLCRGGGSLEDLWAFNEERVARALRETRVPVICGVGHETDFTIADFAADVRAPTPTAAAELISPDRQSLLDRLGHWEHRLDRQMQRMLGDRQQQLDHLGRRLLHPADRLAAQQAALELLWQRLQRASTQQQHRLQQQWMLAKTRLGSRRPRPDQALGELAHLAHRLTQGVARQFDRQTVKLNALNASLRQLDPHAVLGRGYSLAMGPDGRIVRDAAQLAKDDALTLSFARGQADVRVETTHRVVDTADRP